MKNPVKKHMDKLKRPSTHKDKSKIIPRKKKNDKAETVEGE